MSRIGALAKGASVAGAVAVAVGGVAYGIERLAIARIRRNPDGDPLSVLAPIELSTHTMASHDGGTINFVDSGFGVQPATLVLSHGVTLSIRTWIRQLQTFPAAGFRTIAFDHRGHGLSRAGNSGFSVANLGDDLRTLIVELDLRNVVIVGHSMGGIGAQAFLAQHRTLADDRVAGLVLLSTLPSALSGSQSARLGRAAERLTRRTPDSTRLWANPQLGMLMARFGFGRDPVASELALVRQMMLACPRETRVHGPRSLIGFSLVNELANISQPTLIIGGTADVITPPRDSRRMHNAIPNSQLIMLDGGGHMLMLERAETVNRLITEFASSVCPSGSDD